MTAPALTALIAKWRVDAATREDEARVPGDAAVAESLTICAHELAAVLDGIGEASASLFQWRDMATAPTDGTRVLVFDASWCGGPARVEVSYWQPYSRNHVPQGSWAGISIPAAWMPIPLLPSTSSRSQRVKRHD